MVTLIKHMTHLHGDTRGSAGCCLSDRYNGSVCRMGKADPIGRKREGGEKENKVIKHEGLDRGHEEKVREPLLLGHMFCRARIQARPCWM